MTINATNSAINSINHSLHKVEKAADELASLSVQTSKDGGNENIVDDILRPIMDLKEAELETSAAARIIRAENEMLGSIIDIEA